MEVLELERNIILKALSSYWQKEVLQRDSDFPAKS